MEKQIDIFKKSKLNYGDDEIEDFKKEINQSGYIVIEDFFSKGTIKEAIKCLDYLNTYKIQLIML